MLSFNRVARVGILVGIAATAANDTSCKTTAGEEPPKEVKVAKVAKVDADEIQRIAGKAIYFGHQSVGGNILDGVRAVTATIPGAELKLLQTDDPKKLTAGVWAHSLVGANEDPLSKIGAFAQAMDRGFAERADVAFFKLCYIDFNPATDVRSLFVM